jgi:GGDEF domain-containing protein
MLLGRMQPHNPAQTLHSVVHSYLSTLLALSEAVGEACPAIGRPHQQRLGRLRTRLSFDATKEAIEKSVPLVRAELFDFATKAAAYTEGNRQEWHQAADQSRWIARTILKRQGSYVTRVKNALTEHAGDAEALARSIMGTLDGMMAETESIVVRLDELMRDTALRVAEMNAVDPATGLMNRREMERYIAERHVAGDPVVRLLYRVDWEGGADAQEVMRQAAMRLVAQTRPEDLVARWGEREMLVIFMGKPEIAERRSQQIMGSLSATYSIDGAGVPVQAHVECLDPATAEESVR